MSDGLRNGEDERVARRDKRLARVMDGALSDAVKRNGGELLGFSVKFSGADCLVTLRAAFPAGRVVCFVGGETLGACLLKGHREATQDSLRWKEDKYAR